MAKGVILLTNKGTYLFGSIQCSNGAWFDAEGCFKYCQDETEREYIEKHQAFKLISGATLLAHGTKAGELWYKGRENFIDVEIPYEVNQSFPSVEELLKEN